MRKVIIKRVFLLLAICLWMACSSDDETEPIVYGPVMVSTIPANGASQVAAGRISMTVVYDMNISFISSDLSKITLNEGVVNSAKISGGIGKELSIDVTLEKGKAYTLTIPKGMVTGPSQSPADEVKISFTTIEPAVISPSLVNSNAIASAQKVYTYLLQNYGSKTISCTMAKVNWNVEEADRVHTWTGKYPAMNCFDYVHLHYSPANWIDYSNIAPVKEWWDAGGLVAANWHWNVPKNESSVDSKDTYAFYKADTQFDADNATVSGTWENKIFTRDLETMAIHLKLLQEAGIPVLWRPFHEAAGGWFWWGKNAASLKKMWIAMFDYFKTQSINNLIWVFTSEGNDANWYPGDAYVDIVGRDLYTKTVNECTTQYATLYEMFETKMIALSECGGVATISSQWNAGAHWSWFMPWYDMDANTATGAHIYADKAWWIDAMNQNYVITRDKLPGFK